MCSREKISEKPVDKNYRFIEHKMLEINIDGLKDMQKVVEGDIESWNYISKLYRNGIVMYCNDEGKIDSDISDKLQAVFSRQGGND